jgi:flavin-dependent dehydrogenase
MVRELAASTPGVELLLGETVVALLGDDGRPAGVQTTGRGNRTRSIQARLVVGADGRGSTVARLAAIRGRVRPHNRFFYFAYWRGVRPRTANARGWLLDPDAAAQFPNEDDVTALVTGYHRCRLTEVRADLEHAYVRRLEALPDGPDLSRAERVSKLIGKLEMPNVMRPAARPGIAFVGDAAVASDPLVGVGCGWAFQSAEWLAEAAAPALVADEDLDAALDRYRRLMRRRLGPHHFLIADYASGRRTSALERAIYRAAVADPYVVRAFEPVGTRRRSPATMLNPRLVAHVIRNQVAGTRLRERQSA